MPLSLRLTNPNNGFTRSQFEFEGNPLNLSQQLPDGIA